MSEPRWTKDPWVVGYGNGVTGSGACCHDWHEEMKTPVVYAGQGEYHAANPRPIILISSADGLVVAHVIPEPNRVFGGVNGAENAHLIASAPDLYAELLCARHTLVILCGTPEDSPCIQRIDAALASARGEA